MSSQARDVCPTPGPTTAQELFEAAWDRVEPAKRFAPDRLELAQTSSDGEVRLAADLYQVAVGVQNLDLAHAASSHSRASQHFDGGGDPRLRWWYHHLEGLLHMEACEFVCAHDSFDRAAAEAETAGLVRELEKTKANVLAAYCRAGDAPAVAAELLRLVRENESAQLEPVFYQVASYALHWLGEFEFAYSLRRHGMQTANPSPARLARDHREFARILIGLGRLDEADFHLRTALEWNDDVTVEEAVRTIGAAVKCAVARRSTGDAYRLLDEMRWYGAPGEQHERAIVGTAQLLIATGDIDGGEHLLDSLDPDRTTPPTQTTVSYLRAEVAAHRGDHDTALGLFRRASEAPDLIRAPAETIAAICREISPWLSTTGPDLLFPPVVESRFFDGSRWLMAAARDIRRSMAPSRLALESDMGPEAKLEVLAATVDDLNLLGSFLGDGAGATDSRLPDDFWTLHPVAGRLVSRCGATLRTEPEPGTELTGRDIGLAGRMAFGLIAIVADHASPGAGLVLRVDATGFVIEANAMTPAGLARVQKVLAQLCAPFRARNVILPSRASFVATYRAGLSLGWEVDVASNAQGAMTVSVVFGNETPASDERYLFAASPAVIGEPDPAPLPPRPPMSDPELFAKIADYHDRRLDAPEFDFSLMDAARAHGDVDLLAATLLVAASAELWRRQRDSAVELLDELRELIDAHPHLNNELWPSPLFLKNREFWVNQLKGDLAGTWIAATEDMLGVVQEDSLHMRMVAAMNWATTEIDRGELASAWLFSNMCDPTRTSEEGRLLELYIHNHVLLAERRFDEAVPVARERLALAYNQGYGSRASALESHARTMSAVGRFSEAWGSVNEYGEFPRERQAPLAEALAASVLWAEGRRDEAYAAAVRARENEDFAYGALTLTMSVPIEAEGLLARGELEAARQLLDSFPIERQRYLDLPHRLDVEGRVGAALGDRERQLDTARALFSLRSGQPRWAAREHPIYYKFWRTMEAAVRNDRQRIEAEQTAVAAVVTHDLRNSLTAVTLATELAACSPSTEILERAGQALEPIRSLAGQLDAVAQWDGASRVTAGDLVDIDELLDSIEFPNKSVYELSGGVLEVRSDLPGGLVVPTKRSMLAIILSNLVGNAIKHGRRDGTVRVSATSCVDVDSATASVIITVDDDGPGLSADQVERLREGSKDPVEPSRGLGLWIVRRYAAALGLPVVVGTSELGGTSVAIHIKLPDGGFRRQPAPAVDVRGAVTVSPRRDVASRTSVPGLAGPGVSLLDRGGDEGGEATSTRRHVLVVEDDTFLSTLIVEFLARQEAEVTTATTASEAIQLLDYHRFDVVLTDVDLADGSTGYEVLASIFDRGLGTEVVVMSGQAIEQTRIDLTRQFPAPVVVLQKPFTLADLSIAVGC